MSVTGQLAFAALLGAALLATAASVCREFEARQVRRADADLSRLEVEEAPSAGLPGTLTFVERLPVHLRAELVIRELQRGAATQQVVLGNGSISEQSATDKALGHTTISVTLRGPYPRIKDTLAAVAERFPAMAVKQVSLRRAGAPTEVDARMDLLLATRPLAASAASGS